MSTLVEKFGSREDLPHPHNDPTVAYCHEGKQYTLPGQDVTLEIVRYEPGELEGVGGVVVIDFVDDDHSPLHETDRDACGIKPSLLEPYIDEYGDEGAVMTGHRLLTDVGNLDVLEVDIRSYDDLYYEIVEEEW